MSLSARYTSKKNTKNETSNDPSCGEVPPEAIKRAEHKAKSTISRTCIKCKTAKSIIFFRRDSTCWLCFEELFVRKFKQQLNVGRKLKNKNEPVLIGFSGGPSSRALIHVLHDVVQQRSNNPNETGFYDVKGVLYIDEGAVLSLSPSEREENRQKIEQIVKSYGHPFYSISLEEVFLHPHLLPEVEKNMNQNSIESISTNITSPSSSLEDAQKQLHLLFDKCTSNTSREDLLIYLRRSLLTQMANQIGASKLFLGTTSTRLSIEVVALVCKGRGYNIPQEMGATETNFGGMKVCYPMRDILAKEVAIYNRNKKIESLVIPTFATKATNPKFSINFLAESFIYGLQAEFPHTIHTLMRSASKLTMGQNANRDHQCCICSGSLSPAEIETNSKLANTNVNAVAAAASACSTEKSKEEGCTDCSCNNNNKTEGGCCTTSATTPFQPVQLKRFACYGCQRILQECEEGLLPPLIHQRAVTAMTSSNLREQIKDFLLDDNE